jgi:hypothetical protein
MLGAGDGVAVNMYVRVMTGVNKADSPETAFTPHDFHFVIFCSTGAKRLLSSVMRGGDSGSIAGGLALGMLVSAEELFKLFSSVASRAPFLSSS